MKPPKWLSLAHAGEGSMGALPSWMSIQPLLPSAY
jgi:hypothetical protein